MANVEQQQTESGETEAVSGIDWRGYAEQFADVIESGGGYVNSLKRFKELLAEAKEAERDDELAAAYERGWHAGLSECEHPVDETMTEADARDMFAGERQRLRETQQIILTALRTETVVDVKIELAQALCRLASAVTGLA